MNSLGPHRVTRAKPPAITLVECSVKVSPTLARLIRKCAEKEAGGAAPGESLLAAAGVLPDELAELRRNAELASVEIRDLRALSAQGQQHLDQSKNDLVQRDDAIALLRAELRRAADDLQDEQRRRRDLTAALEDREGRLARSLSTDGLDPTATEALAAMRDRLAERESAAGMPAAIANLGRPEILALSGLIDRRARRLPFIRWLLS